MNQRIAGIVVNLLLLFIIGMGMVCMAQAQTGNKEALIVVDPGFSGFSYKISQQIAAKLTLQQYEVKVVKVKQFQTSMLTGLDLIVFGGPTYMGQPSGGIKGVVAKLAHARVPNGSGLKTLVFQTGGSCVDLAPLVQMLKEKGFTVAGSCGILCTPQAASEIDNKIKQLLEIQ